MESKSNKLENSILINKIFKVYNKKKGSIKGKTQKNNQANLD
jgi:hypothetical protein